MRFYNSASPSLCCGIESMIKYVRLMYNEQQTNSDFVNLTSLGKWSTEELILQDNTGGEGGQRAQRCP